MTVPATPRRAGPFTGNGVTTSFPFTFKVFSEEDLRVVRAADGLETTLVVDSDYSVTLNSDQDASPGGSITYPLTGDPLPAGETLTIAGALELTQELELPGGGAFNPRAVEDALDRVVIMVQQVDEVADRALTLPVSAASGVSTQLPVPEANNVIGWDENAQALVNLDPSSLATVVVAGTSYTDVFDGTGSQTAFALTANPGSVNALDVAISGVSQVNGVDFSVSGTTLTFTSAPPAGTGNIAVRYVAALPVGTADAQDVNYSGRSLAARNADLKLITDAAGIAADGTDQTADIVTWLGTLGASAGGLYVVPYNCKFSAAAVMDAMPPGLMFLDLSGLNSYAGVGDTAKRVGLFAKDLDTDDSAWQIASGHNAVLQFNNFGNAGTTSAEERIQGIVYSAGMYSTGAQGYREMAETLLKRSGGNAWWEWNWNSMAPWVAVGANYERWVAGVAATSGVTYVLSNFAIYVAASSGTTGATRPTHSSGTVSDGGVNWTFVRTAGATIMALDEYGRLRSNGGVANTDILSLVQNSMDPATSCVVSVQAKATNGTPRFAQLALTPTDGATPSVPEAQPVLRATAGAGLQVFKSDGSAALASFTDAGGLEVSEFRSKSTTAADGDATPSVAGVGTLYLSNSGATTITALDDGEDGQIVRVITTNANTSFTHSSTLTLTGSASVTTPAAYSSITFERVPSAISARWVEVARSLK